MIKICAIVVVAMLVEAAPARTFAQGNLPSKLPPIQITGAGQLYPIAISGLKDLGGDGAHNVSRVFNTTLIRDLGLSSFFRIINSQAYIEDPQTSGYDIGQFNFGDWRSINAEFLVKGAVSRHAGKVMVEALLFDVGEQRRMMGKRFTGEPNEVSEMARRFADAILEAVTGKRGPFNTKLAFVSTRGGRFKEVYTSWLDGGMLYRVTDNPTINLFPSFDRSVQHLLYLSYKTLSPALYLVDLSQGIERRIAPPLGMAVGGTLTPDGQIVGAFAREGHTNLYLLDQSGNQIRTLTDNSVINVSPSICSDGSQLAFTSDRSGNPQLYVMKMAGGGAQRLTYQGDYNTAPAFSPDCKKIAYESRSSGIINIFVINIDGSGLRQLTNEGSNEGPTWSPDGRYLAFSSTREGDSRVYLMLAADGRVIAPLTKGEGNATNPSWSWWLGS
ncbi:MAG: PD40 domain-containing protein [Deltaproteobacteria bacterium]|nr:PD40 domain-containing protein [Deltaproteobacteria bacterium]